MIDFDCELTRPDFRFQVAFKAEAGVTALFGPSGSGKTTAIRLLAGLERPNRGTIRFAGETVVDASTGVFVAAHRRRVGLVFQDALLLPHLSVRSNLTYGRFFTPRSERRIAFDPVIETLGIGRLLERRPATLSGGERQRVAIGRALLASPRLLLMDEPLASLDGARKQEILPFIERLRDEFDIPIIYVSHSVEEVARLARAVIRLEAGRVAAAGSPAETLGALPFATADRFDDVSILTATIDRALPAYAVTLLTHPSGTIVAPGRLSRASGLVRVAIRATNVALATTAPEGVSVRTVLSGRLEAIETDGGPFARATLVLTGGERLRCYATRLGLDALDLTIGAPVYALVKSAAIDERAVEGSLGER